MNIIIWGVRIIEDSDNRGSDNRGCTVVRICYCYNFHIFLSQKYNSDPERCPVDWQDLMMVLAVQ